MSKRKKRNPTRKADHSHNTTDRIAAKKAAVLGNDKKRGLPLMATIIAVVLASAGGYVAYNHFGNNARGDVPVLAQTATTGHPSQYAYPVTLFSDGIARHFEHTSGPNTIRYFILKSSDGIIRAAFDACDVCWPAGKGYVQDGDVMICRNCGRRFDSIRINEVKGGCNPAPLNRQIADGKVVVKIDDILAGEGYFDFSRRRDS